MFVVGASNTTRNPLCPLDFHLPTTVVHFELESTGLNLLPTLPLEFEQRHNSKYRYSKIKGNTPLKALAASKIQLGFPTEEEPPKHRLKKPEIVK
jgi:hypothetical protein